MARKKGGGGKLNRSAIIQARLDPKLHMATEIMARNERRTLSSFIEHSIEQLAKKCMVRRNLFFPWWSEDPLLNCRDKIYSKSDMVTVEQAVQDIGTDHEAIRFFRFAMYFPDLLNRDEEEMFNKIILTKYFWMHYPANTEDRNGNVLRRDWVQVDAIEGLLTSNLLEYWEKIKLNQICEVLLSELPIGKKISAPLKEDPRAIKKYIKTNDSSMPYKIIFAWSENSIELSRDDQFWNKNAKNLVTKKIEIKQTEDGPEITATFVPSSNKKEQKAWFEFCNMKMEETKNGD